MTHSPIVKDIKAALNLLSQLALQKCATIISLPRTCSTVANSSITDS